MYRFGGCRIPPIIVFLINIITFCGYLGLMQRFLTSILVFFCLTFEWVWKFIKTWSFKFICWIIKEQTTLRLVTFVNFQDYRMKSMYVFYNIFKSSVSSTWDVPCYIARTYNKMLLIKVSHWSAWVLWRFVLSHVFQRLQFLLYNSQVIVYNF